MATLYLERMHWDHIIFNLSVLLPGRAIAVGYAILLATRYGGVPTVFERGRLRMLIETIEPGLSCGEDGPKGGQTPGSA